jgi:hypothetical protein
MRTRTERIELQYRSVGFASSPTAREPSLFVRQEQLVGQHRLQVIREGVGKGTERTVGDASTRLQLGRGEKNAH